jgi:DUF4097 and DUF4098 domain-containing protein YvlB
MTMSRKALRAAAVLGLASTVGLVAACDPHMSHHAEQSYQVKDDVSALSVTGNAVDVEVTTGTGPVRVREKVDYSNVKPNLAHQVGNGVLSLTSPSCAGSKLCDVHYVLQVPANTKLSVDVGAGRITTTDLAGDLDLKVNAGDVRIRNGRSRRAHVNVDVGDVTLRYAKAPSAVDITTHTGGVKLQLPSTESYAVQAHTDVGKTDIKVPTAAGSDRAVDVRVDVGQIGVSPA